MTDFNNRFYSENVRLELFLEKAYSIIIKIIENLFRGGQISF